MSTYGNCEGITRRDALHFGLAALGLGGMVDLLRWQSQASESAPPGKRPACILIWMDGGPSHFETFDPKPEAPLEIRGEFEAIDTKISGVQFSQHLPRLASIADKFAVVRSVRHDQGN